MKVDGWVVGGWCRPAQDGRVQVDHRICVEAAAAADGRHVLLHVVAVQVRAAEDEALLHIQRVDHLRATSTPSCN